MSLQQLKNFKKKESLEFENILGPFELMLFILRARMMDITESTGFPTEEDRIFATVNGESCVVPYYLTTNVRKLHQTLFDQEDYEPSPTVQDFNEIINEYVD